MATEKQLAFFQSMYEMESRRLDRLRSIAQIYLGLSSTYSAFIIFTSDKLRPEIFEAKLIFSASILAMLAAFILSLNVLHVARFERVADPVKLIEGFGDTEPTDAEFFDDRIVEYAVASNRDCIVNTRKARYLSFAGYCILVGLAAHAMYFVDAVVFERGASCVKATTAGPDRAGCVRTG